MKTSDVLVLMLMFGMFILALLTLILELMKLVNG